MSDKPKIGILALTLELYESLVPTLREGRQQWLTQQIIPKLREHMNVCFDGVVFTRDAIEEAVENYHRQGVDGIVVMCLTYSPSELALPALSKNQLPIMVWNTQQLFSVDANFTSVDMIANHGVHGTQDLCSVLCRHGVKFQYATSHPSDKNAFDAVKDFAVSVRAVKKLATAKVGQLGGAFPHMGDFAVDTTHLAKSLGPQVIRLTLADLNETAIAADANTVAELVEEYRNSYKVAADVTGEELEKTARVEIAITQMVEQNSLSAMTYLFSAFGEDDRSLTLPFVAADRLMARGVGFGGEGDIVGALGNFFLNELAMPASFSEIFTADFAGNSLFMSHMGEANVAMANGPPELIARPEPITKTIYRQLALRFAFAPGEITLFSLVQGLNNKWRFIVSAMDIIDWQAVEDIPCPQFKIAPRCDIRDWLTAYAKAGGPHHNAVCRGDARSRLKMAADILNVEYIEI